MKYFWLTIFFFTTFLSANTQKIAAAFSEFNKDEQLKFATTGLYIIDAATGETVFEHNGNTGLAPASTEKVVTAATALDVLGKDFTYETKFGIVNTSKGKSIYIQTSGDPTLGSWRWNETKEDLILAKLKAAIQATGIKQFESVIINTKYWSDDDGINGRWIWEDLGQYYGASSQALNWRENQFDLIVKSGSNIGDAVTVVKTNPYLYDYKIVSKAKAAVKGIGDQSALYYPSKGESYSVLKGEIPAGENNFVVAGSMYDPSRQFAKTLMNELDGIASIKNNTIDITTQTYNNPNWIYTHTSPTLSKIVYWFLRKSVNLYGEALLRTIALKTKGEATTDKGIEALQQHWANKGIDKEELHLCDGSGLSPQNRITPHAEVMVLKYAKGKTWYDDFYDALPIYNDMKMKSGTINRVKGFTGFHKSTNGKTYIFSMIVNNHNGSAHSLIRKMYKVLDQLK